VSFKENFSLATVWEGGKSRDKNRRKRKIVAFMGKNLATEGDRARSSDDHGQSKKGRREDSECKKGGQGKTHAHLLCARPKRPSP